MSVSFYLVSSYCFAASNNCVSSHYDEDAVIDYVIDGDTVVLTDSRRIRLIGINTPELSHNDKMLSEEGAELAKEKLSRLLSKKSKIRLLYDKERFDRHGRTLAHIYQDNGLNIQAEMLQQGLAFPLRIGPNLLHANCYDRLSQEAKQANRGLWALARYETYHVSSLSESKRGFYFISGKVERVTESRTSLWINLENNVALRIHKDDLNYFNKNDLMSLQGKTIEANGWLYKRNKQLRMRIRHKLDLKQIN